MNSQTSGGGAVDLSVTIPVYNNAATLNELIDRLLAVLEPMGIGFELIFVDDGSRDDSLRILQERAARDARIRPFALVKNFGSQAAICAAFDQVRGRRVVCMDADLENCPEDIPALLEPLDRGYDLVCGYRQGRSSPWLSRRIPSWLMNVYVRRHTRIPIRDVGCGIRALQAWIVRDLASEGEARRLMTPVFLKRARKVAEVPVHTGPKDASGGHSFFTLLGIAADYYLLTARRPFLVSGLLSLAGIGIGCLGLALGPPLAGLIIVAASVLALLLSLIGEYCQRLYQLAQGLPFYQLRDLDAEQETARKAAPGEASLLAARVAGASQ